MLLEKSISGERQFNLRLVIFKPITYETSKMFGIASDSFVNGEIN